MTTFSPQANCLVIVYSGVPNNRPPRLLILKNFQPSRSYSNPLFIIVMWLELLLALARYRWGNWIVQYRNVFSNPPFYSKRFPTLSRLFPIPIIQYFRLKCWQFLGHCLNLALFIKKECMQLISLFLGADWCSKNNTNPASTFWLERFEQHFRINDLHLWYWRKMPKIFAGLFCLSIILRIRNLRN